ncbi:hypothetical protein FH972_026178 [Carpinus fangiana]|uniref:Uncharacterized protein n=1 Tax=Carpinus fangiana TaxID=176857 RepID=A0A5N6L3K5_9ROSI|nr:hypothetical protein FH972_026178 [Carpinus fangiana]
MLWVQQLPILVKRILLFHHLQKGASKASADGLERQQQPASALIKHLSLVEDLAADDCKDSELPKVLSTCSFMGLYEETDEISSFAFIAFLNAVIYVISSNL